MALSRLATIFMTGLLLTGCVSHPPACQAHFFYTKKKEIVWACHDCGKEGRTDSLNHVCSQVY